MNGWRSFKLGDLAEKIGMGPFGSNIKISTFVPAGIPVISGTHLKGIRLEDKEYNFITEDHATKLSSANVYRGDVIFTHAGNIGQVVFIPANSKYNKYILSQRQFFLRCNKEYLLPEFVAYYFKSRHGQYQLLANANQTGVPSLAQPVSYLKTIEIRLPPLPEQRAIAGVLSSLDDKIDILHHQNKTLEGIAETIFRQYFLRSGNDWPMSKLSEHIHVLRGLSYRGSGLSADGYGVPMHNLNSVFEGGGYKYSGIKYYNGEFKERHIVEAGDVIVANTEQGHQYLLIGYPAIVPKKFGSKGIFSQHIFKTEIQDGSPITRVFLYYFLKSQEVWEQVVGAANGSTVNMLPANGLETATFCLPPSQLIDDFSQVAASMLEKQEENILNIDTISRLRDTLLPKLMSGDVRVKV